MKPNPEETPEGYCDDCGLPCYGIKVDEGIGAYEFQGSRGFHHDYTYKSHCCLSTILESSPVCDVCGKREVYDCGVCLDCYILEMGKCESFG